ncbi:MAG: hypothetical protein Q8K98_03380 [Bacteroidota bacterium]|nr:hypothetical protein [Bacteroidota bacterium]
MEISKLVKQFYIEHVLQFKHFIPLQIISASHPDKVGTGAQHPDKVGTGKQDTLLIKYFIIRGRITTINNNIKNTRSLL